MANKRTIFIVEFAMLDKLSLILHNPKWAVNDFLRP